MTETNSISYTRTGRTPSTVAVSRMMLGVSIATLFILLVCMPAVSTLASPPSGQPFFTVKQWSDGNGFLTTFLLKNKTSNPVQYSVEAYNSEDQNAAVLLDSDHHATPRLSGTLPPEGVLTISTSGQGINQRSAKGWVRVDADQAIEVSASTRVLDGGKGTADWKHVDDYDLPRPSTVRGTTGLFHVESADVLRKHEYNIGVDVDNYDRMPGDLDITTYNGTFAYGLTNHIELSGMVEAQKGVNVGRPLLLSTYQPATQPLYPGTVLPRLEQHTANGYIPCATCRPGFFNDIPLISGRGYQSDMGDIYFNMKGNIFSQSEGSPVSFGLSVYFKIPSTFNPQKLDRGRGTGNVETGANLLLSRDWGDILGTHFNAGYSLLGSPKQNGFEVLRPKDHLNFNFGFNLPSSGKVQFIGELLSQVYVGGGTPNTTFGAADPVDLVVGLRILPTRWLSLGGGYRRNLNQFSYPGIGDGNGYVAQLQFHHLPEKPVPPNHPPTVTCSANPTTVTVGDTVQLNAVGSDPDNDPLTYVWSVSQGKITQNNATATWDTTGVSPGTYNPSVHVSDGRGGTADCSTTVTVNAPPAVNHPPTCNATADRTTLLSGETTQIHANGSDPDGDTIQYSWNATAGTITGSGDTVTYQADGPGAATITVNLNDGHGGTTSCSVSMNVQAPPPPPEAQHLKDLLFKRNSARVDNVAKAQLDDFALKLQNDPKAHGVLIGHADKGELHPDRLAKLRAENAKAYLVKEKKIDESRIEVRSVGTTEPADTGKTAAAHKANQRVEMVFVPEGAKF